MQPTKEDEQLLRVGLTVFKLFTYFEPFDVKLIESFVILAGKQDNKLRKFAVHFEMLLSEVNYSACDLFV